MFILSLSIGSLAILYHLASSLCSFSFSELILIYKSFACIHDRSKFYILLPYIFNVVLYLLFVGLNACALQSRVVVFFLYLALSVLCSLWKREVEAVICGTRASYFYLKHSHTFQSLSTVGLSSCTLLFTVNEAQCILFREFYC